MLIQNTYMPKYRTVLVRTYLVEISADDEKSAARLSELYVGFKDSSNMVDRERFHFQIEEIEITENNALETSLVEESSD